MKRFFALVVAAALVTALFYGCGKGGEDGSETTNEAVTNESGYYTDDSKIPLEIGDMV
jgi:hypothetical protein